MPEKAEQAAQAKTVEAQGSLLERIVEEGRLGQTPEERARGKEWVQDFIEEILKGQIKVSKDTEAMINARIATLDELLSNQLNEIVHAAEFQRLEASWRGLQYFVMQSETSTMLKIKVMNVSKRELLRDLQREIGRASCRERVYVLV